MSLVDEVLAPTPVSGPVVSGGNRPALVRALRFRTAQVGLVLTLLVLVMAIVGPWIAPHSPTEFVGPPFSSPSGKYVFGTDFLGRDVLSRMLHGGRSILWMTLGSTFLGVVVGASIGMLAGYVPKLDNLLIRPLEVIQGFPALVLILLFISLVGPKVWLILLLVALAYLPIIARLTRGMTLDIATRDFVGAAEIIGFPRRTILRREILMNITTPLLVQVGLMLTQGIAIIAGLNFTGQGLQPPSVDWGLMINENRQALTVQPWPVLVPAIVIATFAIGTTLLTEGVARTIARVDRES
jgi:peptide/nickel transport system permease protein